MIALLVSQNRNRLARVMIAVVKEKDDFSANFLLDASGCENLSDEISLGKKSARLLAETDNRVIHGSERVSYLRGRFRAAKHRLLQDWRHDQYGCASNKIIPEVTDVRRSEQDEDERLCNERGEKNRGPGDSTNKERCQEKTENAAVENRTENVACFDEILDQARK